MISYGKQNISQEDIESVVKVLNSDFLTQGPKVPEFEKALCDYTGTSHAVAVNSATSALHIACLALGLGPGDWLWTTPITFVASANCGLYCGASVDFVDIDPVSYNMSISALEKKLRLAEIDGKLPKVLVPVHMCGQSCDMKAIKKLSGIYGFKIVEDASHAIGGQYLDGMIGSCNFSDITIFSFHPVKVITSGEGGAALTNSKSLAEKMMMLRSHGVTRDPKFMEVESHGPWYYEQILLGYNCRMTDLEASLGLTQLKQIDKFVKKRRKISRFYERSFENTSWTTPKEAAFQSSAWHLYILLLPEKMISYKRNIVEFLMSNNIGVNTHYIPVHTQPYFKKLSYDFGDLSNSEKFYERAITVPLHTKLEKTELEYIVKYIKKSLTDFSR